MKKLAPLALLLLAFAALYAAFPARTYECDAVIYSSDALKGDREALWYPGHLGFAPLVGAASIAARAAVPPRDPIPLLQLLSAIVSLAALALFQRTLVRLGAGEARAAVCAGLLGASYGWWHFALQGESHVLSSASLVLYLWCFVRVAESPDRGRIVAAALALGLATLMHQKNVVLSLTALAGGVAAVRGEPRRVLALAVPFALVYAAVAVLPYFAVGIGLLAHHDYASFHHWFVGISEWSGWGKWERASLAKAAIGVARTWIGSHFLLGFGPVLAYAHRLFPGASLDDEMAAAASLPAFARVPLAALAMAAFVATGAWLVTGARHVAAAVRRADAIPVFLAAWLLAVSAFATWWAPERTEFWMDLFAPAIALLAVAGRSADGARRWRLAAALLAGVALVNVAGSIRPQALPGPDRETRVAMAVSAALPRGSTVLADVPFRGRGSMYASAFEKVDLLAAGERAPQVVDSVLAARGGRGVYLLATPQRDDPARRGAWQAITDALARSHALGAPVPARDGQELRPVSPRTGR